MSDGALCEQVKSGSQQAFGELYKRYYLYLVKFASKICGDMGTAEDIAADAFVNFWKNRQRINETSAIKGYLTQSTKNLAIQFLRSHKKTRLGVEQEGAILDDTDLENKYIDAETHRLILNAIENLTDNEQQVIKLLRDGKSVNEIVVIMEKSQANVSQIKKRAITRLHDQLRHYFQYYIIHFIPFFLMLLH